MKKISIDYEKLAKKPDAFLDVVDSFARSLGYEHSRYCSKGLTTIATFYPKKNELITHDNEKMKKADKLLLGTGLRQIEGSRAHYTMLTTCGHFYNQEGLMKPKTEGIIIKVRMEGWDAKESKEDSLKSLGLRVTDVKTYGWGSEWRGLLNKSLDGCFKRKIKVPKDELIIELVEGEIERRFGKEFKS